MLLRFKELSYKYFKDLENDEFFQRIAYLSDIFETFNDVNLSLQGRNGTIVDFVLKLSAFIQKFDLWKRNTENIQCGMFKCLSSLKIKCSFSEEIATYLASLKEQLEPYFPEAPSYEYITNPFSVIPDDLCRVSIEFLVYLNFNFILKIEATYSIAQIIKSGCNLIARKRLASKKILEPRTF